MDAQTLTLKASELRGKSVLIRCGTQPEQDRVSAILRGNGYMKSPYYNEGMRHVYPYVMVAENGIFCNYSTPVVPTDVEAHASSFLTENMN